MPKPHDAKPRNKHRRDKYEREMRGKQPTILTQRQVRRRFLQRAFLQAASAQIELEKTLRTVGIRWRDVERAVKGNFKAITPEFIDKFIDRHATVKVAA